MERAIKRKEEDRGRVRAGGIERVRAGDIERVIKRKRVR